MLCNLITPAVYSSATVQTLFFFSFSFLHPIGRAETCEDLLRKISLSPFVFKTACNGDNFRGKPNKFQLDYLELSRAIVHFSSSALAHRFQGTNRLYELKKEKGKKKRKTERRKKWQSVNINAHTRKEESQGSLGRRIVDLFIVVRSLSRRAAPFPGPVTPPWRPCWIRTLFWPYVRQWRIESFSRQ